jgi:hypothetical protein
MNQAPIKTKGRPPGGISLVDIKLADLIAALGTDQLIVPVGRVWLEKHGISVVAPAPTVIVASAPIIPVEEKIEFKLTTFED